MKLQRPKGITTDKSLPKKLGVPEDACNYVGRKVCKLFASEEAAGDSWFVGTVTDVSIDAGVIYLEVLYDDGDTEELEWEEFRELAVIDRRRDATTQMEGTEVHARNSGADARPLDSWGTNSLTMDLTQDDCEDDHAGSHHHGDAVPATQLRPRPKPRHNFGEAGVADAGAAAGTERTSRKRRTSAEGGSGTDMRDDEADECDDGAAARQPARRRLNPSGATEQQQHQHVPAQARAAHIQRSIGSTNVMHAGHIDRIQLVNFMNHRNTEIFFSKHVTFVAGKNGSGKSAMLQGLQACLGASARDTGRGSSLGEWVASDQNKATVTLDIWNTTEGECDGAQLYPPYRHEIFGSMIRVQREITAEGRVSAEGKRAGRATFVLRRADNSKVGHNELGRTAGKEVAALAAHFNIDASNPLIVITQEKVKGFHEERQRGGGCLKYNCYMSGTCMADVRDKLAVAARELGVAEGILAGHRERLTTQRAEFQALDKRKQDLQLADVSRRLASDLEVAAVWASVAEAKGRLQQAKTAAAAMPARLAAVREALEGEAAAVAELQALEKTRRDGLEQTRAYNVARLEELNRCKLAAKNTVQRLNKERDKLVAQVKDLGDKMADLEADLQGQRSEAVLEKLHMYQRKVTALNDQLTAIQTRQTQAEARRLAAMAARDSAAPARTIAWEAREEASSGLREARKALAQVQAEAGGGDGAQAAALARRLGNQALRLTEAVQQARPGTFSRPPIGPIARYLRRVAGCPSELVSSLELALAGVMDAWVTHSNADAAVLRRMRSQAGGHQAPVFAAPYRTYTHDYGAQPVVDAAGVTWHRVIDLVEPVEGLDATTRATLMTVLLDHASAAKTVLVRDREEGQAVARQQVQVLVDRQVTRAFDVRFVKYEMRGWTMITTPGSSPGPLRLAADMSAQLADAQRAVQAAQGVLATAEASLREAEGQLAATTAELHAANAELLDLNLQEAGCKSRQQALLAEAPATDTGAASADILANIGLTQKDIEKATSDMSKLELQINSAREAHAGAAQEYETQLELVGQYTTQREELMEELERLAQRKAKAAAQVAKTRADVARVEEEQRKGQADINEAEAAAEQATDLAMTICSAEEGREVLDRMRQAAEADIAHRYANKPPAQREALLQRRMAFRGLSEWADELKASVARAERDAGGDLGAITVKASQAERALRKHQAAVDAVSKKVSAMREAHDLRLSKYRFLISHIDRLSNNKFYSYMMRRNFVGSVRVSHEQASLELVVRKGNEKHEASNMMQLSGGERSLTTSSFLLAMGEVVAAPFRAMDEYDVYMDTDRRKVVTMALLDCAWRFNPSSQLVLLSPQDTAILTESLADVVAKFKRDGLDPPPSDFMKVILLPDPRKRLHEGHHAA